MNVESFDRFLSFTYTKELKFNDTYLKCHQSILRNNVNLSFFGLEGVRRNDYEGLREVLQIFPLGFSRVSQGREGGR